MKRVLLAAALVAAVAVLIAFTLPSARLVLPPSDDGTVAGVLHIHTNRSDGRSSPEEVAAAAARAGLKFIVLTDHGDATRTPDPPTYRDGVLCLDGVEISTTGGHYVAIGLPAAPYPLGGEPRDVVEDVARLGGFGIAAHPDSPKHDLKWDGWSAPFDALEVINPDTGWRLLAMDGGVRAKLRLFEALSVYPLRSPEAIAGVLNDTAPLMARWAALTKERRVVAVAGTDAHALMGPIPMPSYETSFRMLSVHVTPDRPLTGDATSDAAAIVAGLRAGHVYTTVDGFATGSSFHFEASNDTGHAAQGDELAAAGPVALQVSSNAPAGYTTTIWRGPHVLEAGRHEPTFTIKAPDGPGVYRVEIRASDRADLPPWLVSNPVYVRTARPATDDLGEGEPPATTETLSLFDGRNASQWRIEEGRGSHGTLKVVAAERPDDGELSVQYQLAPEVSAESRIALLVSYPQYLAPYDRVTFAARAKRPMRISVQLRTERGGVPDERWQRSIYVDSSLRTHTVHFDDLSPIGDVSSRVPVADMPYVLFVVDLTNAKPGDTGEFWISDVALQK